MTAPSPRPSDEQTAAALAFADRYPGESHTSVLAARVRALDAEVRALHLDVQMAEESAAAWKRVADGFRADLRRIAGGNVPAVDQEDDDA